METVLGNGSRLHENVSVGRKERCEKEENGLEGKREKKGLRGPPRKVGGVP